MNNKNIIHVGAIAIGLYIFSQGKSIFSAAAPQTTGQRTAQKVAQKADISRLPVEQIRDMIAHAQARNISREEVAALIAEEALRVARSKAAYKAAQKKIGQPTTQAARIAALRKAVARKAAVRKAAAQKIGKKIGKTVAQKVAPKRIGQPTTQAARIAAARRAAARKAAVRKAAVRKAAAQKIGKKVAQKVAQKRVAPWKAPYKFPKSRFRVITPSDILRNLAKKDIARKKAEQQKMAQKTTHSTPSDRRKKRLEALYGSHWREVWIQRPRRR